MSPAVVELTRAHMRHHIADGWLSSADHAHHWQGTARQHIWRESRGGAGGAGSPTGHRGREPDRELLQAGAAAEARAADHPIQDRHGGEASALELVSAFAHVRPLRNIGRPII